MIMQVDVLNNDLFVLVIFLFGIIRQSFLFPNINDALSVHTCTQLLHSNPYRAKTPLTRLNIYY